MNNHHLKKVNLNFVKNTKFEQIDRSIKKSHIPLPWLSQ